MTDLEFLYLGDMSFGSSSPTGIGNIVGTPNQIYVNTLSGTYILSTPQDIAPISGPTFSSVYLTSYPNDPTSAVTVKFMTDALSTALYKGTADAYLKDITIPLSGLHTIDTVSLNNGDTVLRNVPNLSGTAELNGLYIVNESGNWFRKINMDEWSETVQSTVVITNGSGYIGSRWYGNNPESGVLDVDPIQFIELTSAGEVGEAPIVGKTYGRKDAGWTEIITSVSYGDIKTGIQTTDHSGWIKLDGRLKSSLTATQQSQATALGIGNNLPNGTGAVLLQNGTTLGDVAGSMSKIITQGNLPNVNLTAAANGAHTHTATGAATGDAGNHSHVEGRSWDPGIASRYNSMDTGINSDYRASGTGSNSTLGHLVSTAGNHSHTVNFTLVNSVTHTHTTPLGGAGTALDITPKSLSVNYFLYLGA